MSINEELKTKYPYIFDSSIEIPVEIEEKFDSADPFELYSKIEYEEIIENENRHFNLITNLDLHFVPSPRMGIYVTLKSLEDYSNTARKRNLTIIDISENPFYSAFTEDMRSTRTRCVNFDRILVRRITEKLKREQRAFSRDVVICCENSISKSPILYKLLSSDQELASKYEFYILHQGLDGVSRENHILRVKNTINSFGYVRSRTDGVESAEDVLKHRTLSGFEIYIENYKVSPILKPPQIANPVVGRGIPGARGSSIVTELHSEEPDMNAVNSCYLNDIEWDVVENEMRAMMSVGEVIDHNKEVALLTNLTDAI
jgi:hypothetical protein